MAAGDRHAVEPQLGRVRGAAAELVELAHQLEARGAARHDEQRLAAVAEFRVDGHVDHVQQVIRIGADRPADWDTPLVSRW